MNRLCKHLYLARKLGRKQGERDLRITSLLPTQAGPERGLDYLSNLVGRGLRRQRIDSAFPCLRQVLDKTNFDGSSHIPGWSICRFAHLEFLILLWVRDELAYDRFHAKADRTYRILWNARYGNNEWTLAKTPIPLADVLREQFPGVESVTRFTTASVTMRLDQEWVNEGKLLRVEPGFFDVFTVRFLKGSPTASLADPSGIVLTTESAHRYFGETDPIGQTIDLNNGETLTVTDSFHSMEKCVESAANLPLTPPAAVPRIAPNPEPLPP
ncbi:MAG: ABC transporter permease [Rhodothermales bacterium]